MMKKTTAALLETVHLAAISLLFTMAAWIATIPGPVREWKGSGIASAHAGGVGSDLQEYLLHRGPWLGLIALLAVAVAGTLRGDTKKMMSVGRIVAAGLAALFALWAAMDLPEKRLPTAWNCLFVALSADLLLTAWVVGGGKGGGSKSASAKAA